MTEKTRKQESGLIYIVQLVVFCIFAYAISWAIWWPLIADLRAFNGDPNSLPNSHFLWLAIGGAGPNISAIITVALFQGWSGLKSLFSRILIWRVAWFWYAFALLAFPIADIIARSLFHISHPGGILIGFENLSILAVAIPFALISGALMEELGWRGFMQPFLRQRLGLFSTAIIIGIAWAFWHTPLFFTGLGSFVSGTGGTTAAIGLYVLLSIMLSLCIAWMGDHTQNSVFLAYLFHVSVNIALGPILLAPADSVVQTTLIGWTTISLLIVFSLCTILAFLQNISKTPTDPVDPKEGELETYWLFLNFTSDHERTIRKTLDAFVSGNIWDEGQGFIIFESHSPKSHIFNALNALGINSDDMMLLGKFGSESVMVLGKLKDTSLLDMVEIG